MMVGSNGRALDMGDPRTPMAWQHRDLNYQQSGFQDRYGPAEGSSRMGPPSTSDRLSHRTDKSSRVSHRDSRDSGQPHMVPYGQYPGPSSSYSGHHQYPPSRPSYSSGRPASRPPSPSSSSSSSSSTSTSDPDSEPHPSEMPHPGQPVYGYGAYPAQAYPNFHPSGPPTSYAATMRSARSVPALTVATWDGEPCPVHGGVPHMAAPSHPGFPVLPQPTMAPLSLPPPAGSTRRASSVYDVRMAPSLPSQAIYGTLPVRGPMPLSLPPPPGTMTVDRKSIHGSMLLPPPAPGAPTGIPPHLLPPMARPRPIVVGERGAPEPLPVRNPEKGGAITPDASNGKASVIMESDAELIKPVTCCRGGVCVLWIVLSVICIGVLLAVMLKFIL